MATKREIVLRGCVFDVSHLSQKQVNELQKGESKTLQNEWNTNTLID